MSALMTALARDGRRVGLTSIGYDGEELDNVTGLPKPRITVGPGNVIATARRCFTGSEAALRLAQETDISTPLGPVWLAEAEGQGRIVLAGPNTGRTLRAVLSRMETFHPDLVLVDGALNRIVPLMETDGVILTTGAARSVSVDQLAGEVRAMARLFGIPAMDSEHALVGPASFTRAGDAEAVAASLVPGCEALALPGLVSLDALRLLVERSRSLNWGKKIIFRNVAQLVLTGDAVSGAEFVAEAESKGFRVGLRSSVPLLFVTVNPFYPRFRAERGDYTAASIDAAVLARTVRRAVNIPVIDVVREGSDACLAALSRVMGPWT